MSDERDLSNARYTARIITGLNFVIDEHPADVGAEDGVEQMKYDLAVLKILQAAQQKLQELGTPPLRFADDDEPLLENGDTVIDDSALVQAVRGIRFEGLRIANLSRCRRWHPGGVEDWSPERWFTATAGELGEAGNALKKFFRVQDGIANKNAPERDIQTREQAIEKISDEIGDTLIYLDLFAASLDIDLEQAMRRVFNRTSEKYGFPERIGEHSVYMAAPESAKKGGGA